MQLDFVVDLSGLAIVTGDTEGKEPCRNPTEDRRHERRIGRPPTRIIVHIPIAVQHFPCSRERLEYATAWRMGHRRQRTPQG